MSDLPSGLWGHALLWVFAADRDFDSMAAGVARGKTEGNKRQKWHIEEFL